MGVGNNKHLYAKNNENIFNSVPDKISYVKSGYEIVVHVTKMRAAKRKGNNNLIPVKTKKQ